MAYEVLYMQTGETPARLDRWWIDRIFSEGVSDVQAGQLLVTQRALGANLSVDVAAGDVIVAGDDIAGQGKYLARSTAVVNVLIPAPPLANSRIDLIVLRVLDSTASGVGSAVTDGMVIEVVAGVAGAVPAVPAVPASAVPLAQVLVAAGAVSIVTANVTDRRLQLNATSLHVFGKSRPVNDHGTVTGLVTLAVPEEAYHVVTASGALTVAFSGFTAAEASVVPLDVSPLWHPVTWPAEVVWPSMTPPLLGPGRNLLEFLSRDGGATIFGDYLGGGYSLFYGGYLVGIIDTTRVGSIIAADASQVGAKYALIVSPKSLEQASLMYKTTADAAPAAASTRWNGLAATAAMASATYPAANYCNGLGYPADGGSKWYLPAMDELELIYRTFKATAEANTITARVAGTFPGVGAAMGENLASSPTGAGYTASVPGQTANVPFRDGGGQDLGDQGVNTYYWSATEYSATDAWFQSFSGSNAGTQTNNYKANFFPVRPVRRVLL